ncbi:hypothetical protein LQE96_02370 [Phocea massiliensis]|uniref:hypothetical protein n=1 Tax=Merdimmobilis hominis TaxID=2897707 RepID=UPI001E562E30|nr:hypothetical protein [Merdimmobilis hominis]MCD4835680.1 hypothetical protein [Merdimmobilis hominis]
MSLNTIKLGDFVANILKTANDNFSDLESRKANTKDIPQRVSQLENDRQYQTASEVAQAIADLVNSSPEALDTLRELAEALGNDPNFATTIASQLGNKVDKEVGKGLSSNDYTTEEKSKLANLKNYTLPVAGEALGGVKNGGNVTINTDGTLTAPTPEKGASVERIDFTATDSRWGVLAGNQYTITLVGNGKSPIGVYRKGEDSYLLAGAGIEIQGVNILVSSIDKFEGYLLVI